MNFDGFSKQPVPRFGSLVQWDSKLQLPLGLAQLVRNGRYTAESYGTRWGLTNRLKLGAQGSPVTGLGVIRYLPEVGDTAGEEWIDLLGYTASDGNIYAATPFVQSTKALLTTPALLAEANIALQPNLNPVIAQAFNRGYIAQGNLSQGVGPALVYDPPTGNLDPVSDLPFGFTWVTGQRVRVGQVVAPTTFTGSLFRCTQAGVLGATEPNWPAIYSGGTVNDGTAIWTENTPVALAGLPDAPAALNPTPSANAGSPITNGATVFVALTYNNPLGEAINELITPTGAVDPNKVLQWKNTTGSAQNLTITLPNIPAVFGAAGPLGATYGATTFNVYVYIVQGTPNVIQYTDPTFYAQLGGGPFAPGATVTISAFPTLQAIPTVNTAYVTPQDGTGAVDVGVRYMVLMFESRTEYDTGWSGSIPIRINVTASGQKIFLFNLPIGSYNCAARILAFTVAGASAAGPYTYVAADDVESPGFNQANINITATFIDDNTTTSVTLNFTDTYLPGATDVTNYADRIQVPPASDIYFSKTLGMVVYTGCAGYPSGHLVSDLDDPEAVRVPGSNLQVSETDGDRTVCWREVRENQISFKENSAHVVISNDGDPNTWDVQEFWRGMGPTGPKAVDIWTSDQSAFIVFAHKSGPYLVQGNVPQLIGRELLGTKENPGLWQQINWQYGNNIKVVIDGEHREVHFLVPFGNSTVNNMRITLNYFYGWDDPVIFAQRSGKLVPNVNGRKWSLDDVAAADAIFMPQRYTSNPAQVGVDLSNELVFAGSDGALYTVTEGQYHDEDYNGDSLGYFSGWISVPGPRQGSVIVQLGGATIGAIGNGMLNVYALDEKGNNYPLTTDLKQCTLTEVESVQDFGIVDAQSSAFGIGFDNGSVPDAWFEIHLAMLYTSPMWTGQAD